MAKALRVNLQVAYQLLSTPSAGLPEAERAKLPFTNLATAISTTPVKDDFRDNIVIAGGGTVVIDLTTLGTIDYLMLVGDGLQTGFSVTFSGGVAKACKSLFLSDGPVPHASMTLTNLHATEPISISLAAAGH